MVELFIDDYGMDPSVSSEVCNDTFYEEGVTPVSQCCILKLLILAEHIHSVVLF